MKNTRGHSSHGPASSNAGFTLIELLVVIAIIGMLSSVVLASLNGARNKGKDARRIADLKQIQIALELYYSDNNAYPISSGWRSECAAWGNLTSGDVIPGLVPTHISSFPSDPAMNKSGNLCCYIYNSNGVDYKLLAHNCPTISYQAYSGLIDPARDSGANACLVDGTGIWSWAVYTSGACSW